MKKILLGLTSLFASSLMFAQQGVNIDEVSLYEHVTNVVKKTDNFHLYLNMHGSFNGNWIDPHGFQQAKFNMDQLRIEARGNVNDWIYYRWRQRLNRSNNSSGSLDNLPTSIDYAAVGFKITPKFSIFAGKQCASYGGFEFDLNPIEIYEYSDMVEYMQNFLTGVNFIYNINKDQELCFQILDSRNHSFKDTYGNLPSYVNDTKCPLVYTLNWNGSFAEGLYKTRWSASLMQETRSQNMAYFAMGNELNIGPVNTFLDIMYSREGIDRKQIITDMIGDRAKYRMMGTEYLSFVYKLNYRFLPKWNAFVKGMCEIEGLYKSNDNITLDDDKNTTIGKGRYRTAWGYLAGIEFYPMDTNLHFFLTFIGRTYNYSSKAKVFGWDNYSTQKLSLGFIYQLPMF